MPEDRKDRREKMAKEAKTNAMRMLDRQKVKYEAFSYECDEFIDGIHSADKIGAPYDQSFKTLVMEGKSGGYFVFVVPIEKEVDRKAAAKAVGEKTVDMIHVKDITKITGYVRGGCSDGSIFRKCLCGRRSAYRKAGRFCRSVKIGRAHV